MDAHVVSSQWSDHVERDDEMDDENYQTREVYAKFGLTVYFAQVLEAGVVNLLTIARIFPDGTATRKDFATVMDNYFRRTFGSLRTAVTPYLGDDVALLNDLQRAVEQRNMLIHRYWYERIGLMTTVRGRNRMLAELDEIKALFQDIDARLDTLMLNYAAVRGVSQEDIQRLADEQRLMWEGLDGHIPEEQAEDNWK